MKGKMRPLIFLGILALCFISCSRSDKPVVARQAVGPIKVNCCLLYDEKSREAALFDVGGPEEPDIFAVAGQVFELGGLEIRAILSPGHSRGSLCYGAGDALISGDVLFAGQVGRTGLMDGGKEAIVKSVRDLYAFLPDETKVYPGHAPATDIGTEKKGNEEVSAISVTKPGRK